MPPPDEFRALFDAHVSFVWRVLQRHGVAERELEDACQEVFVVVHRRADTFDGRSAYRTWLYGIAVRVALGFRRKGYRVHERMDEVTPEQPTEAAQHERVEQKQFLGLVDAALTQLSEEKREVFALYEIEQLTMAEVALALGVPENTALYRLYAARSELRQYITRNEQRSVRTPARTLGRTAR